MINTSYTLAASFTGKSVELPEGSILYHSNTNSTLCITEVTPADFTLEQLLAALPKEIFYPHGLGNILAHIGDDEIFKEFYKRQTQDKLSDYFLRHAQKKEKTLADFSDSEIQEESIKRMIEEDVNDNGYCRGYEAGKRDAEPRLIDVKEKLPKKDGVYYIRERWSTSLNEAILENGKFKNYERVSHWMALPAGHEKILNEQAQPKSTCAQCGAEFLASGEWECCPTPEQLEVLPEQFKIALQALLPKSVKQLEL